MSAAQALDDLGRNTLTLLGNSILVVSGPGGVDTTAQTLGISDHIAGRVNIAPRQTLTLVNGIPDNKIVDVACYWTPMRLETLPSTQRRAGFARHTGIGGLYDFWFTPQITGCTILVVDWGTQVGVVHLRPYSRAQYSGAWGFKTWTPDSWRAGFRSANRAELTAAVAATGGTPHRYILVETLGLASRTTVLGVRRNDKWRFYVQRSDGNNIQASRRLAWANWSAWSGWEPANLG